MRITYITCGYVNYTLHIRETNRITLNQGVFKVNITRSQYELLCATHCTKL